MLAVAQVSDVVARRAEHVISENERVVQAVCALEQGALADVGRLMNASHESLRLLYEVSSPELDLMVSLLRQQPGCLGARLTGAGFGGCAVALMESGAVEAAVPPITARYRAQTGLAPALYVTRAAAGAHVTPI
jgi:galactokinase